MFGCFTAELAATQAWNRSIALRLSATALGRSTNATGRLCRVSSALIDYPEIGLEELSEYLVFRDNLANHPQHTIGRNAQRSRSRKAPGNQDIIFMPDDHEQRKNRSRRSIPAARAEVVVGGSADGFRPARASVVRAVNPSGSGARFGFQYPPACLRHRLHRYPADAA